MAETKTQTMEEIFEGHGHSAMTQTQMDAEVRKLGKEFEKQKKVKRKINKAFQKRLGKTHYIGINGVGVVVPVDGTQFELPESFAEHLDEYLANLSNI
jgi:hypothetical protein